MSPRQQRMYDAIKGCLSRPEASTRLRRCFSIVTVTCMPDAVCVESDALDAWTDEQARTLVGVVDEVIAQLADEEFCARNEIVPEGK